MRAGLFVGDSDLCEGLCPQCAKCIPARCVRVGTTLRLVFVGRGVAGRRPSLDGRGDRQGGRRDADKCRSAVECVYTTALGKCVYIVCACSCNSTRRAAGAEQMLTVCSGELRFRVSTMSAQRFPNAGNAWRCVGSLARDCAAAGALQANLARRKHKRRPARPASTPSRPLGGALDGVGHVA